MALIPQPKNPALIKISMAQQSCKVLIVDSVSEDRQRYGQFLTEDPSTAYEIIEAETAAQGLALAQQLRPDVALVADNLPDQAGLAVLRQWAAREQTQEPPTSRPSWARILMAAQGSEAIAVAAMKAGAQDYLAKATVTPEGLRQTVTEAIAAYHRQCSALGQKQRSRQVEALQSRKILDSLFSFVGIISLDGTLLEANRTALEVADLAPEMVLGRPFAEAYWWSHSSEAQARLRQAIRQAAAGEMVRYDAVLRVKADRLITIDFTLVPVLDESGQVEYLIPSGIDITERKQAEAALMASEWRYRTLFKSIDEGFCVVEVIFDGNNIPCDYCFVEVNPAFEQQTGLQQAVGKTIRQLLPDVENWWIEHYGQVALTGESLRFEQGSEALGRWFEVYACRIGEASARQVAIVFKDISDRKRIEHDRERLLAQSRAAQETAEKANRIKDEFLAIVSHELRTPLNPILGWSQLLLNRRLNQEQSDRALSIIERNAKIQAQLIDDLLDVSRILRGKLSLEQEPVDLSSVIDAATETVRLSASAKAIQIRKTPPPVPAIVLGDASRLQQVCWNLLSNAIKFTPEGGHIEIEASCTNNTVQLSVCDTGQGIAADFLPQVFDRFRQQDTTLTRQFGGLGLGLAIVRHLVELHGGRVWAESPGEGLGATFTVALPLMTATRAIAPVLPLKRPSDLSGVEILLVDDEADALEIAAFLLEDVGAKVTPVKGAREALATLVQQRFHLLISDIGMPEVDGYRLMQWVRALPPEQGGQIPAIALTAYAGEMDYQLAMAAGFQRHISKPVEAQVLVAAIAHLVGNSLIQS